MKLISITFLVFIAMTWNCLAKSLCDPDLTPVRDFGIKYKKRGDRCEGLYKVEVSGREGADLVGLVIGSFGYKMEQDEVLEIHSPIVDNIPVNVRAIGIPARMYYRMDALIKPKQKVMWPVKDVLLPAKVSHYDIGVFGWIDDDESNTLRYIPISVDPKSVRAAHENIRLMIRPWRNIKNLNWRWAEFKDDKCGTFSEPNLPDNQQPEYSEMQPIQITLPTFPYKEVCIKVSSNCPSLMVEKFILLLGNQCKNTP